MKTSKPYLFVLLHLLLQVNLFSQNNYYPGGLSNSNLKLWLNAAKASSLTYNGSNQVSQWADLSGNGYNFGQITTGNQPVYGATAGPNNRPGLNFTSASSQNLGNTLLPVSISYAAGISTLSVINYTATGSFARIFDFGNGAASDNIIAGRYNTANSFYYEGWYSGTGGQTYTTTTPIVNGTNNICEAVQQGGTAGATTSVAFYSAGALQASNGQLGSSIATLPQPINRTSNFIGRSNWVADAYFNGSMSEILFFNTALNTTQRVILENYLSSSWAMPVTNSYFTPPTTTTYNNNLVGIGYTTALDNVLTNSATDGLGFTSGTGATDFLNTAGFVMAAHNGQANTILTGVTLSNVTPPGVNLLNRSWFIHKSGGNSAGNITFNFNFNDYNSTILPTGMVSYGLLYNAASGNFSSGTNSIVTKVYTTAGTTVSFVVPAASMADGYYTLVWSTIAVLPVEIINFTAQQDVGTVNLTWQNELEQNCSYFEVQRATAAGDFAGIGRVLAAGNNGNTIAYSFSDNTPVIGWNSYRLKIVNLDGSISFSTIRKLAFIGKAGAFSFIIYPNPATKMVAINCGQFNGTANIEIINSTGQPVWKTEKNINGQFSVPVSFLEKGVFFIKITAGSQTAIKRFVKN